MSVVVELVDDVRQPGSTIGRFIGLIDIAASRAARTLDTPPAERRCPVTDKLSHPTERDARRYARTVHKRGAIVNARAYQCQHCGAWHLTTKTHHRRAAA